MNKHSSTTPKYYPILIGAALLAASLFQFSRPVFSAGTDAGQIIRNTATGTYDDNDGNTYTIDSNTVEVTVAKVAGITNIPTGFVDETTGANNNSVLTNDLVSFEFTITNVGNDSSNIYIPSASDLATKGLDPATLTVEISTINPDGSFDFDATPTVDYSRPADGIVGNVPANGELLVRVQGTVTATAAGAPVEVRLGDTPPNADVNAPVPETQNQPDTGPDSDDNSAAANDVRTTAVAPAVASTDPGAVAPSVTTAPADGEREASSVRQVFLGSNPLAAVKIEKTRVIDNTLAANTNSALDDNIITYNLDLEVLTATPSSLYTPGSLTGRDFGTRMSGVASVADASNLVLVSDAIPAGTFLNSAVSGFTDAAGRVWTPVYATSTLTQDPDSNIAADQINWVDAPTNGFTSVTRVGWVYDASSATGAIEPSVTPIPGFTFDVVTTGLNPATGGSVANIAQVFGNTVNGPEVFDESGDQDPSNFSGAVPGPRETNPASQGIANPANHGVDSENNNNANGVDPDSPGGEDNVVTIGAAGTLINGPIGQPAATGNVFGQGPDNNHDFQNKGISNFNSVNGADTNAQQGEDNELNPDPVVFNNTLSNPGDQPLQNVLLQPINPEFNDFSGATPDPTGGEDADLPEGTKVTINLGTQQAIYTYTNTSGVYSFILDGNTADDPSQAIEIPTLAAGVPLNYTVTVDLPGGTKLSTDLRHGFAVPIIAFVDGDDDGTPDNGENSNYTVNQVYTGFVRVTKQVKVVQPDGSDRTGMGFGNSNADKKPLPGDTLVYRVNYRNISEPQSGNGNNVILNGVDVTIDENGTLDAVTAVTDGNNWALDNNTDGDLDTINVQGTAVDSNGGTITYYTGATDPASTDKYSVDTLTSAGTTDPGDTVTGYRSKVPLLAPSASNSNFTFQRKVDEFDGLAQDIDSLP